MDKSDWILLGSGIRYKLSGETRIKSRFSLLGVTFASRTMEWSGKLFGFIEVEERKRYVQYSYFDDGWSYQNYWGKTNEEWEFVKFI